ncbi:hypothetical protein T4D_9441 [Trichinella pseudospiralis]|uniref:Uncharacterized protein n=1 Tax=Trichinella pseudospiralis TaxID=6337 RepID=A0A0V1FIG3_TRIPS|nr:hypothetical protein T4D_9441 [Trichinella pseudospiralis]
MCGEEIKLDKPQFGIGCIEVLKDRFIVWILFVLKLALPSFLRIWLFALMLRLGELFTYKTSPLLVCHPYIADVADS